MALPMSGRLGLGTRVMPDAIRDWRGHHEDMTTDQDPSHPDASSGGADSGPHADTRVDPERSRSIFDVRRSREDKMVAGVCSGVAAYLDIDPVVVRVLVAVLSLVGFAGLVLYVAAWLLLPETGAPRSVAAEWFGLKENEPQVRTVGLIVAGIIAVVTGAGMLDGDGWGAPFPFFALVALGVFWVLAIRPYQRHQLQSSAVVGPVTSPGASAPTATATHLPPPRQPSPRPANPRHDGGRLFWLTVFAVCIAMGIVWVYSMTVDGVSVATPFAVATAVVAAGILVGAFIGNGRPLVPVALVLSAGLALAATLPSITVGQRLETPRTAAAVQDVYSLGLGETVLDLTDVSDLDALSGRTVRISQGLGSIRVLVPSDLPVDVSATSRGSVEVFGESEQGENAALTYSDSGPPDDRLRLVIGQRAGEIEVIHP